MSLFSSRRFFLCAGRKSRFERHLWGGKLRKWVLGVTSYPKNNKFFSFWRNKIAIWNSSLLETDIKKDLHRRLCKWRSECIIATLIAANRMAKRAISATNRRSRLFLWWKVKCVIGESPVLWVEMAKCRQAASFPMATTALFTLYFGRSAAVETSQNVNYEYNIG